MPLTGLSSSLLSPSCLVLSTLESAKTASGHRAIYYNALYKTYVVEGRHSQLGLNTYLEYIYIHAGHPRTTHQSLQEGEEE